MIFLSLSTIIFGCTSSTNEITYSIDNQDDKTKFGVSEIKEALLEKGFQLKQIEGNQADLIISILSEENEIKQEGFKIEKSGKTRIRLTASDAAGSMYGELELAEQIKLYGWEGIKEVRENPYMKMRGTKFNIPLDLRTPSYSHASDAAQNNIAEMWNFDFWKAYIDHIAKDRYNFISCWSLHPFPSLIKVPEYPDIALDNVHRSTVEWDEYYSLGAQGLDSPEILDNYEVLKKITIDEKIAFWRKVMAYGKSRNVDFYFVTWNIFVNGTNGKYGITDKADNPVTKDYFRKSIIQLFRTYPDLAGIGLTTGENMHGVSFEEKENWAFDTYAEGVLDAAKEMPDRKITFIHRQHQADPEYIEQKFEPLIKHKNINFIYSFKYAKAHVFSSTTQPYHEEFVKNIGSLKTIWTLRNDDVYYFRWGSPKFVREFIKNIPYEVSNGMYYGSDQWVWGREFTSKNVEEPRQLEIKKHWYHWLIWGRLSYNPEIDDQRFSAILQTHFPNINTNTLFEAWHEASMIYPVTTGFHWGSLDFQWYIEGCRSHVTRSAKNETGFHDVDLFINFPVHPKSGNQTIQDYARMILNEESSSLRSPVEVSEMLHDHANKALKLQATLNPEGNEELSSTLNDIKTISYMGKYYAHKIAGSTYVELYRNSGDKKYQEEAVKELTKALESWEQYIDIALENHINPIWTNRVGYVDWIKLTKEVKKDIELAKQN